MPKKKTRAKILGYADPDTKTKLIVACFRLNRPKPGDHPKYHGQLSFVCPICGHQHWHGAGGPNLGDGDGERCPHCMDRQPLSPSYHLREVLDPELAGDLPRKSVQEALRWGEETPKKPATILDHRRWGDMSYPIIAAYRLYQPQPGDDPNYAGQLAFVCPWCGRLHTHGACGPNFGNGDGHRASHCTEGEMANSGYILREIANPELAGDLPAQDVQKALKAIAA